MQTAIAIIGVRLDRGELIRLHVDRTTFAGFLVTYQAKENLGTQDDPVSIWIEQLAACDPVVASRLWEHFMSAINAICARSTQPENAASVGRRRCSNQRFPKSL